MEHVQIHFSLVQNNFYPDHFVDSVVCDFYRFIVLCSVKFYRDFVTSQSLFNSYCLFCFVIIRCNCFVLYLYSKQTLVISLFQ